MTLTFDNVPTTKQLQDLMQTINRELGQGNLVRLVNDWDIPNGATIIQRVIPASMHTNKAASADSTSNAVQTIEQIAALPHVLLYPGGTFTYASQARRHGSLQLKIVVASVRSTSNRRMLIGFA